MISHNLKLTEPLEPKVTDKNLTLCITEKEKADFKAYMCQKGIDFKRPVMLVGVTAKLEKKTWPEDRMTEVIGHLIEAIPQWQLIFNYAPGREAENARRIFEHLDCPQNHANWPQWQPTAQPILVTREVDGISSMPWESPRWWSALLLPAKPLGCLKIQTS